MGVTFISGTASSPAGERRLDFLVDSGAQYSQLPREVWEPLSIGSRRKQRFRLADGTLTERDIGNCGVSLDNLGETPTPVVLGGPGDPAVSGAVTLEDLGLVLAPFTRTLHPANLLTV